MQRTIGGGGGLSYLLFILLRRPPHFPVNVCLLARDSISVTMSNRLNVHYSAVEYKFIYIYIIYDWLTNNDRVKTNIWLVLLNHAISSLRSYRYRLVVTLNTPNEYRIQRNLWYRRA